MTPEIDPDVALQELARRVSQVCAGSSRSRRPVTAPSCSRRTTPASAVVRQVEPELANMKWALWHVDPASRRVRIPGRVRYLGVRGV